VAIGEWLANALGMARANKRAGKSGGRRQEELDLLLHGAARDADVAAVGSLLRAGAQGLAKGWGGRDALTAAMCAKSPHSATLARLLAPVSDPRALDEEGLGALGACMGRPWLARLRPIGPAGAIEPWAEAFWVLLPWADVSGPMGFDLISQAIESDWPQAMKALGARVQWGDRSASARRERSLALAMARAPSQALAWGQEGRARKKEWENALGQAGALPEMYFDGLGKAHALSQALASVEARSLSRVGRLSLSKKRKSGRL
jgi:hypothetical protein